MFKIPGIKTKEGLKVSGIYGLALSLLLTTFFPDVEPQDVFDSIQDVVNWYHESEGQVIPLINKFLNIGVVGYLLNRVKKPKDETKSIPNI